MTTPFETLILALKLISDMADEENAKRLAQSDDRGETTPAKAVPSEAWDNSQPPAEPEACEKDDPCRSFEAGRWADVFIETALAHPEIPVARDTMISWFSSALTRGYSEAMRQEDERLESIFRAIARLSTDRDAKDARIQDLLDANNRMLERVRAAEAEREKAYAACNEARAACEDARSMFSAGVRYEADVGYAKSLLRPWVA